MPNSVIYIYIYIYIYMCVCVFNQIFLNEYFVNNVFR